MILRTPDERFHDLPDYPFAPHYVNIGEARMHYVDEGHSRPILCLHGEPTWSFLYRKMIPVLTDAGRVIAPDWLGFGKSDKFAAPEAYSFQMHRDSLVAFMDVLDLQDITLVVQDWGGLLGLRVAAEMPHRFARLVILNTFLPTGEERPSAAYRAWRMFVKTAPELPIGRIIQQATVRELSLEVLRGYEAPFPDASYQAGAKTFPLLVPMSPDDPGAEAMRYTREVLSQWHKPAVVLFSDQDPILGEAHGFFRELIPAVRERPEISIRDAGHYLQEDKGEEIAGHILAFMQETER
jgi:haloalkane dehalogenase